MTEPADRSEESGEVDGAATPRQTLRKFDYDALTPTDFEEFVFDLLGSLGFVNVDWRKGTPKKSSPSDRGRDIEAQYLITDVDGHQRFERWFVDAKHYKSGVPSEALQGLAAWAQAERPDVALVAASGFLSNAAKDWMENYRHNQSPPFRLRHWERPQLDRFLSEHPDLLDRHDIFEQFAIRAPEEIRAAELEYYNRRWYDRSTSRDHFVEIGQVPALPEEIYTQIVAAREEIERKYGKESLAMDSDWAEGVIAGKLSALRWVLGDEWDNMDT